MKAAVFDRFGPPEEVLEIREVADPGNPGSNEVKVRLLACPINPSDLLYIRGEYGKKPALPATPGFEGVGMVEAVGSGLLARRVRGRRVAVLNSKSGNWQEKVIIPAQQAIPIPDGIPDEQAASFFVNPATALVLTQYVLRIPRNGWLLQTAAGSALGRMIIRLGRHAGYRTINVIRRSEQAEELRKLGANEIICTADESIVERVMKITENAGVPYAIDAVGGSTGSDAAAALGKHGRLVVYGTLAEQPMQIHPRLLMVGQKRIEGFWLSEWMAEAGLLTKLGLIRKIGKLFKLGVFFSEIGKIFPLNEVKDAVKHSQISGRIGKTMLRIGS